MGRTLQLVAAVLLVAGCSHPPPANEPLYTPPPSAPPPSVANVTMIADSYANDLQDRLNTTTRDGQQIIVSVHAVGGSGYANRGYRNTVFGDVVPIAVKPADRLVVFFGSGNDAPAPPEVVASAVRTTYSQVKQIAPQAKLLVIGPAWVRPSPAPMNWLAVRDILHSEATAAGAAFVDPIAEGWFVGQPQLIRADGVHPNADGANYLVQKIAPLIAAQVP